MKNRIDQILKFCAKHDIEIVSYGIAPNPFGFCYEAGEEASAAACRKLDAMLESLTEREEQMLRKAIFG